MAYEFTLKRDCKHAFKDENMALFNRVWRLNKNIYVLFLRTKKGLILFIKACLSVILYVAIQQPNTSESLKMVLDSLE